MAQRTGDAARTYTVEYRPLGSLKPNPENTRRHTAKQISKLACAIVEFGFAVPIVIDESDMILAGHARYLAALQLKLAMAPCLRLDHLSAAQKAAFAISDNKLHDESQFDTDALARVLNQLLATNYNIEFTGFETPEIDMVLDGDGEASAAAVDPADQFDDPPANKPAVTRAGDLWHLDKHRLLCGDALVQTNYETLLGTDLAQTAITDPPYNVPIAGNVSGLGRINHREFAMASGEMSDSQFRDFLTCFMQLLVIFSVEGSLHYLFMDWRHIGALLAVGERVYDELKNLTVWVKTNGGMGSFYRSQHELVAVFKKGAAPHINNIQLGKHGRYRTNVWQYAGANGFSATRNDDIAAHPTVKPVAMIADAIKDCSKRGSVILDPFAGSGTVLLAAERTGRRAAAMEIDPIYVDVAIKRWERLTGKNAVLADDGRTFTEVERERLSAADSANSGAAPIPTKKEA